MRERHDFFERRRATPELCAEVTLQPVRRHGVDAAVMFADIMTPVARDGRRRRARRGRRARSSTSRCGRRATSSGCASPDEESRRRPRGDRASCARELRDEQALVGFCGAPFTVAGYLVEGKPTRDFARTKALMYGEPDAWHALMEQARRAFARYVARAGRRRAPT